MKRVFFVQDEQVIRAGAKTRHSESKHPKTDIADDVLASHFEEISKSMLDAVDSAEYDRDGNATVDFDYLSKDWRVNVTGSVYLTANLLPDGDGYDTPFGVEITCWYGELTDLEVSLKDCDDNELTVSDAEIFLLQHKLQQRL